MKHFAIIIISLSSLNVACEPYQGELKRVMGPSPDLVWINEHIDEVEYFTYVSKKLPGWSQVLIRTKELAADLELSTKIVQKALIFESSTAGLDCLKVLVDRLVDSGDLRLLSQLSDTLSDFFAKNPGLSIPQYYLGMINWSQSLNSKPGLSFSNQTAPASTRQILDQADNLGRDLVDLANASRGEIDSRILSVLFHYETRGFLINALGLYSTRIKNQTALNLLEFKKLLLGQSYKEAYALFIGDKKDIFDFIKKNRSLNFEGILKDLYNAGRLAGQVSETAKLLQEIGGLCTDLSRAYAYELSGRLWHSLKSQKDALASFKLSFEAIEASYKASRANEKDYTRIHWYYLREALESEKVDAALVARLLGGTINRPYYDDIFDSFLVTQFRNKNDELLQKIYPSIASSLSPQMIAQYSYVLGFASKDPIKSNKYLSQAYEQTASLYYHVCAALSLKKELRVESFLRVPDAQQIASSDLSDLIDKMIELSYTDLALDTAIANRSQLEAGDFDSISKTIEAQHNLPLETRMLEIRKNLFGLPVDISLLKKTYPEAFVQFVAPLKDRVPPSLQLALLRTESFFNPVAQSVAGAQGLSQFMPETANEMARALKKDTYDILDPETAILFSAVYLQKLKAKHGSWVQALAAYNAGTGRIKKDISATGHTNMKTFADQLDISETRDYIRRIVESAVLYEFLYGDKEKLFSFAAGLFNED